MGKFFAGIVAGAILGVGGMFAFQYMVALALVSGGSVNLPPPRVPAGLEPDLEWRLQRLDGEEVRLADFDERLLFVNNWATWCAPCVWEMPGIEKLAERMADEDVAFVIVSAEPEETVRPFVEEKGWQLPIYVAEKAPPFLRMQSIPSTFILDADRRTAFAHAGAANWSAEAAIEFMGKLLGHPEASPPEVSRDDADGS